MVLWYIDLGSTDTMAIGVWIGCQKIFMFLFLTSPKPNFKKKKKEIIIKKHNNDKEITTQ